MAKYLLLTPVFFLFSISIYTQNDPVTTLIDHQLTELNKLEGAELALGINKLNTEKASNSATMKMDSFVIAFPTVASFTEKSLFSYTYDNEGNLTLTEISRFNPSLMSYTPETRISNTYNAQNLLISSRSEGFDPGTNTWFTGLGSEIRYNADNLVDTMIGLRLSSSGSFDLIEYDLHIYTYDNDNQVSTRELRIWDEQQSIWTNQYIDEFTYENGQVTKSLRSNWNEPTSGFEPFSEWVYTYTNQLLTNQTRRSYDLQNMTWEFAEKRDFTYTPQGNQELITYYRYDNQNFFTITGKQEYTYTTEGKLKTDTWIGLDYQTNELVPSTRDRYEYSADNVSYWAEELWDQNDAAWYPAIAQDITPEPDAIWADLWNPEFYSTVFDNSFQAPDVIQQRYYDRYTYQLNYENQVAYYYSNNSITLNANELALNNIKLQPNPANQFFQLEILDSRSLDLVIYDMTGKSVLKQAGIQGIENIDISNWQAGLYIVELFDKQGSLGKSKLIKL